MKNIILFGIIILLGFGCSHIGTPPPSVCDQPGAELSLICSTCADIGVQVEDIDLLLQVAALRTLDDNGREAALNFYNSVKLFLMTTGTYRDLIRFAQTDLDITGVETLILSRYLLMFDKPEIISAFDRDLILIHIERTRELLGDG